MTLSRRELIQVAATIGASLALGEQAADRARIGASGATSIPKDAKTFDLEHAVVRYPAGPARPRRAGTRAGLESLAGVAGEPRVTRRLTRNEAALFRETLDRLTALAPCVQDAARLVLGPLTPVGADDRSSPIAATGSLSVRLRLNVPLV